MKIGVDVDSILADFIPTFLEYVNDKHDTNIKYEDINHWDWLPCDLVDFWDEIENISKLKSWMISVQPIKGSIFNMKKLSLDHYIKIVSSRYHTAIPTTIEWLYKWDYPFDEYIPTIFGVKKTQDVIDCDILIDDRTKNIIDYLNSDHSRGIGIILDHPWNRDHDKIREFIDNEIIYICYDWYEIYDIIQSISRGRRDGKRL